MRVSALVAARTAAARELAGGCASRDRGAGVHGVESLLVSLRPLDSASRLDKAAAPRAWGATSALALAASAAKQATLNISTEKVAARLSGPPRAPQISLDQTLNVTLEGPPHANSEPCGVCHDSCSGLLRFLTGGIAKTAISAAGTPRPWQSQRPGESGDRGTPGLRRRRASSRERASGLGGPRPRAATASPLLRRNPGRRGPDPRDSGRYESVPQHGYERPKKRERNTNDHGRRA